VRGQDERETKTEYVEPLSGDCQSFPPLRLIAKGWTAHRMIYGVKLLTFSLEKAIAPVHSSRVEFS
jgi:hypothetical protein